MRALTSVLADYTAKVSSFFGNLLPSFGNTKTDDPKSGPISDTAPADIGASDTHEPKIVRPKTKRQITSELDKAGLKRFKRAEARMLALNPQGSIDFFLTAEGFSQYYDMLLSHASYWADVRFATFVSLNYVLTIRQ